MASGVVEFSLARHTPHPPGFPGWIALGRVVRVVVGDPLLALRAASAAAHAGSVLLLAALLGRIAAPGVAAGVALLYGVVPGVWFHAPRAFSTTPALFFTLLAVWLFLRQRPGIAALGWVALAWGVSIRPHLAPLLGVVGVLGVWRWWRAWRAMAGGMTVGALLLGVVVAIVVHDTGGWERLLRVVAEHRVAHFGALPAVAVSLPEVGVVRALGGPFAALGWMVATLAGLALLWRRERLLATWLAALVAVAGWLLLFVHDPSVPRYAPALLCPMSAVVAVFVDRLPWWVTAPAVAASALASVVFTFPGMVALTRTPLPAVAAVRAAAAQDQMLYHSRGLLPFVRLQQRLGGFAAEVKDERSVLVHGERPHARFSYLGTPESARVLPGPTVQMRRFADWPAAADRLALPRFQAALLYRGGVLLGRGVAPARCARGQQCRARLEPHALLHPQPGARTLGVALEVTAAGGAELEVAQGAARRSLTCGAGVEVFRIALDGSPAPVELTLTAPAGEAGPVAVDLLAAWCEGEGFAPGAYATSPGSPRAAARAGVRLEGFYGPERFAPAGEAGAWTGSNARLVLPAAPGVLTFRLMAPSPRARAVTLDAEGQKVQLVVGSAPVTPLLPVTGGAGSVVVEIESDVFVPSALEGSSRDTRVLGVVVLEVAFTPADPGKGGR